MMVGHALLAFGVAALVARRFWSTERAFAFGVVAGVFATIPDVDMTYAGDRSRTGRIRRRVAHDRRVLGEFTPRPSRRDSLAGRRRHRRSRVRLSDGELAAEGDFCGPAIGAGLGRPRSERPPRCGRHARLRRRRNGRRARRRLANRPRAGGALLAAVFGLASHPFGDVFTGSPPRFFYPFDVTLLHSRISLLADPTLNLLAIFGLELVLAWFALVVYFRLRIGDARRSCANTSTPVPRSASDTRWPRW